MLNTIFAMQLQYKFQQWLCDRESGLKIIPVFTKGDSTSYLLQNAVSKYTKQV